MKVAAVIPAYDAARTVAEVVHGTKSAWGDLGVVYVVDPRLKGVVRRVAGSDPDYTNVSIVGN